MHTDWSLVVTDLLGANTAFPTDWDQIRITKRLNDSSEAEIDLDRYDPYSHEILAAERAIKIYEGTDLRLYGQIWEPLSRGSSGLKVKVRDPFAGLAHRRVRTAKNYAAVDALNIAADRILIQNALSNTFIITPTLTSPIVRTGYLTDESNTVTSLSTTADLGVGWGVSGKGIKPDTTVAEILSSSSVRLSQTSQTYFITTCNVTNTSPILTNIPDTSPILVGMRIEAPLDGIPVGTLVLNIIGPTSLTMDQNGTSTESGAPRFYVDNPVTLTFQPVTSVARTVDYNPGRREDEIITELSNMHQGFFFHVVPVDSVPGKMGRLELLYPDAGATLPSIKLEYGEGTLDNLVSYERSSMLPRNRHISSSSSSTGGRITGIAQDTPSQSKYGLFEEEISYSDIDEVDLLTAWSIADIRPDPPSIFTIEPAVDAPRLFTDFNVGDFVRLLIRDVSPGGVTALEEEGWVRIIEAQLTVNSSGVAWTSSIIVETISGGHPNESPERAFRRMLDELRYRQQMLERKVQNIDHTEGAVPPDGGGDEAPPGEGEPPGPDPPPEPPPPSPPDKPVITPPIVATGVNILGTPPYVLVDAMVDPMGSDTVVDVTLSNGRNAKFTIYGSGVRKVPFQFDSMPTGSGTATVFAENAGGKTINYTDGYSVPSVPVE